MMATSWTWKGPYLFRSNPTISSSGFWNRTVTFFCIWPFCRAANVDCWPLPSAFPNLLRILSNSM